MSGLSQAIEEHEQQRIAPEIDTGSESGSDTVYVVATNYDDDPHPHVEGVFSDCEDAKELKKKCAAVTEPPHPVAWQLFEMEVSQ